MANRLLVEEAADGRVGISLQREGQTYGEAAGQPPISFVSPLGESELEDVRWYLEDYLAAPFAVYEERGQTIATKLKTWGQALFEGLFGSGTPGRDAYLKAGEGETEFALISRSATFAGLPWELLWDPKRTAPVALDVRSFDRTLVSEVAAAAVPPGDVLRVLMVIARPAGLGDVGYQMIARPLMERLDAVRGKVQLEVLRPPTFAALTTKLQVAATVGTPYHILHFDGHGTFGVAPSTGAGPHHDALAAATGYLVFEATGGETSLVPAASFALAVNQAQVPLIVLNACRSGMVGQTTVEAAVATRLLGGGAASVVAMGYSVYAIAAAEFMAAFYEALFTGETVSVAVTAGRRQLYGHKSRPSPKGLLPLEDWLVPVHYARRSVRFAGLQRTRTPGTLSLDALLQQMRSSGLAATEPASETDVLAPIGRFVGRDAAFYSLELALQWQRVVVVHGPAGTGKTELAKAFGRWWRDSGGIERPEWVIFHSFEPGIGTFGLDGVLTAIGLRLFGPDFIGQTSDANQRHQVSSYT